MSVYECHYYHCHCRSWSRQHCLQIQLSARPESGGCNINLAGSFATCRQARAFPCFFAVLAVLAALAGFGLGGFGFGSTNHGPVTPVTVSGTSPDGSPSPTRIPRASNISRSRRPSSSSSLLTGGTVEVDSWKMNPPACRRVLWMGFVLV